MARSDELPEWKRDALRLLPWNMVSTLAAILIINELENWPSRDAKATAAAAYQEAAKRMAETIADAQKNPR